MKKFLSILLAVLMVAAVMPGAALAGSSSDGKVLIREYVPGVDDGVTGSASKLSVTTVTEGEESYYQYESVTGVSDAPLGYIPITSSLIELTFMLTDTGSALGFMPAFYDANRGTSDNINYTQMIKFAENGVVITNLTDSTGEYLFKEDDIRWANHKFTLVPNVSFNEKHTVRIEHDPDNLRFALWFDSNKVTLTENASSAYVESCVTGGEGAVNAKGPRFLFPATKGQTFRVYDMYIRGTQAANTDKAETAKIFSGARAYTYPGDSSDNLFAYYKTADGNAVITGFKNGAVPTEEYTTENPLVFPSSLEGCPVTAIADYAFNQDANGNKTKTNSSYYNYENILAIELPVTLEKLGQYSMVSFKNIVGIVLPDSVTEVGNYAFDHIYNTTNKTPYKLVLSKSLKKIGNMAFNYYGYNSARIKELVIPASVEEIGTQAFVLTCIETIIFEGAPTIGTNMFRNNPWLQKVVFLQDVTLGSGFFGLAGNQQTTKDIVIVGSKAMYDAAVANAQAATVENIAYTHSDIFAHTSADVPSVYYWGNAEDATLVKAFYDKTTGELISCEIVPMTAGNSYALATDNTTYNVSNMAWELEACKPLIKAVKY